MLRCEECRCCACALEHTTQSVARACKLNYAVDQLHDDDTTEREEIVNRGQTHAKWHRRCTKTMDTLANWKTLCHCRSDQFVCPLILHIITQQVMRVCVWHILGYLKLNRQMKNFKEKWIVNYIKTSSERSQSKHLLAYMITGSYIIHTSNIITSYWWWKQLIIAAKEIKYE